MSVPATAKESIASAHPIAHEAKEKEQQHYPSFHAHEALCVAIKALACVKMARVVGHVWALAVHRVIDLKRLLDAGGEALSDRLSTASRQAE